MKTTFSYFPGMFENPTPTKIIFKTNQKYYIRFHTQNRSIEPSLTRTALPEWLERDLLTALHIGVVFLSNQSD